MFLIRQLCAIAIGLVLAVPAHAVIRAGTIAPAKLAGIHRVAVISALGDQAQIKKIGLMVFGNHTTFIPIDDWGLDDLAVRAADGKTIGWRWSHVRDGNKKMVDATVPEDPSDWADTADQMTDTQKAHLRKALGDLLEQSIADTLKQLGLVG